MQLSYGAVRQPLAVRGPGEKVQAHAALQNAAVRAALVVALCVGVRIGYHI